MADKSVPDFAWAGQKHEHSLVDRKPVSSKCPYPGGNLISGQ